MSSSLMPSTTLDKYFGEIKIPELYISIFINIIMLIDGKLNRFN